MNIVHVPLGGRAYDIKIGSGVIHNLAEELHKLAPKQKNIVIITEENVAKIHLAKIENILKDADFEVHVLILPSGESTKCFSSLEKTVRFALQHHVERSHALIALGGGVIGDLTGFTASMIRRGCKFIQIPTTLLSQVDSSVGGKTAINTPEGKNLVGAFYQPSLVIIDIDFLKTLPNRDYYAGYAEVVKYGLLGDRYFFSFLKDNQQACDERNTDFLLKIITHSVQMKSNIVCEDEHENGVRALLNLGHTFGHAYEAMGGYSDKLLHGEAIALGMVHAAQYSVQQGTLTQEDAILIKDMIKNASLPTELKEIFSQYTAQEILSLMMQDKKVSDGKLTFILYKAIGEAIIQKDIPVSQMEAFLNEL